VYYTYILESLSNPRMRYIGSTSNLRKRLSAHNLGSGHHIKKYNPWKLKLYIAFETLNQAQKFERYLKTGSGHAFANRHFWI
jgi:predicted GIY-YIG superfamily endonuclease